MNDIIHSDSSMLFRLLSALLILISALTGCATTHRIHGSDLEAGSLQLAQVGLLATRKEIIETPEVYRLLKAGDIKDSDIQDSSVALARVFCCGGPNERNLAVMFYVPPALNVESMDVVEFVVGRESRNPGEEVLNMATKVRQKGSAKEQKCRWFPEDPRLWVRVLYCDGMESEGWVKKGGLYPVWYKPAASR